MKKTLQLLISFVVVIGILGCSEKDPAFDRQWSGNPNKIIINTKGESFSEVAKRILGKTLDSLGFVADPTSDPIYVESLPISITAESVRSGQKVFSISQACQYKKALPAGALFGELDCKDGVAERLKDLAKDTKSGIVELCDPVEVDPNQKTIGYADMTKGISWEIAYQSSGSGAFKKIINTIAISSKNPGSVGHASFMQACDMSARSLANKWYKPNAFIGNLTGGCSPDEGGPGKTIENLEALHIPYSVKNEIKDDDKVVQTTVEISGKGELIYFRGKARCEAYVNQAINRKETEKKKTQNKYD